MADTSQAQEAYDAFNASFVQSIISWNQAEEQARSLAEGVSCGSLGATLAIRQLRNTSLQDTLLLLAQAERDKATPHSALIADHVEHFVKGYDCLRAYRNFYVHCIKSVNPNLNTCVGRLRSLEVSPNFAWIEQDLKAGDLGLFTRKTMRLAGYGQEILEHITGPAIRDEPRTPLASLQKPRWPDRLKKNREHLLGQ